MSLVRLSLFACLLLYLGCAADGGVGMQVGPIVNGDRVNGDEPTVVAVLNRQGGLCTGTVIAPRVVLTAKHCVQSPGAPGPVPASSLIIGVGDNINRLTTTVGVSEFETTPGVYTDSGGLRGALVGIDVAVLVLARDLGVEPYPVYRGSPAELIGRTVRAVGFGQTPGGGAGIKYRTESSIDCIGCYGGGSNVIYTGPTICQGDSGGPLMTLDNQVIGVSSFGSGACGSGINGFNRIDTFMDMVDRALDAVGACRDDGEEVCDGADNDCDGEVDEVCADLGQACEGDGDCRSLLCREGVCTEECNPLRPSTCAVGFHCANVGNCDGLCLADTADRSLPVDSDCTDHSQCASLYCADPGDGRQRCLTPCQGDAGFCQAGLVCAAVPGSCGGCVPDGLVAAPAGLGEPCETDERCRSGQCLVELGVGYCTTGCNADADCGELFHCRPTLEGGVCVRGPRAGVGGGCVENGDCQEGFFCAARGNERWCTNVCGAAGCPPEFSCTDVGGTPVCVPDRGVVGSPCETAADCLSGLCAPVGPEAALLCTRLCSADSPCEAGSLCTTSSDGINDVCVPSIEAAAPTDGGGCSVANVDPARGALWLLGLGALMLRRRRR